MPKSVELHLRSLGPPPQPRYLKSYGRSFPNPSELIHQNLLSDDAKQAHPALRPDVSVGMLFLIGSRLFVFDLGPLTIKSAGMRWGS